MNSAPSPTKGTFVIFPPNEPGLSELDAMSSDQYPLPFSDKFFRCEMAIQRMLQG